MFFKFNDVVNCLIFSFVHSDEYLWHTKCNWCNWKDTFVKRKDWLSYNVLAVVDIMKRWLLKIIYFIINVSKQSGKIYYMHFFEWQRDYIVHVQFQIFNKCYKILFCDSEVFWHIKWVRIGYWEWIKKMKDEILNEEEENIGSKMIKKYFNKLFGGWNLWGTVNQCHKIGYTE